MLGVRNSKVIGDFRGVQLELAAADGRRRGVCSVARLLVSTAVGGRPRAARRHLVGESSAAVRLQVQLSGSLTGDASVSDLQRHAQHAVASDRASMQTTKCTERFVRAGSSWWIRAQTHARM
jgi:hypothetical protein